MSTATSKSVPLGRSDVRSATIHLIGAPDPTGYGRGVEVVAVVEFADHEFERHLYDFVGGHDRDADYGGHDIAHPRWVATLNHAAEWLQDRYPPPPYDPA